MECWVYLFFVKHYPKHRGNIGDGFDSRVWTHIQRQWTTKDLQKEKFLQFPLKSGNMFHASLKRLRLKPIPSKQLDNNLEQFVG